ncbi:MAG: hypothetical protein H6766_02295 [Candidatus Peribacteria bacterium]|nr:MAG: hypothetical protein H6766_02295 [Candidatus Peribacteria bacterium]
MRLLWLQVFQEKKYNAIITDLHYQESRLTATRGDIYIHDKGNNPIPITKNITLYDLYIEPQYFQPKDEDGNPIDPAAAQTNKEEFIRLLTPFVYKHLCLQFGILQVTQAQCVNNIESFA